MLGDRNDQDGVPGRRRHVTPKDPKCPWRPVLGVGLPECVAMRTRGVDIRMRAQAGVSWVLLQPTESSAHSFQANGLPLITFQLVELLVRLFSKLQLWHRAVVPP